MDNSGIMCSIPWLVGGFNRSTHLKNMSQHGNLPQIGMNIKNIWVATTQMIFHQVVLLWYAFCSKTGAFFRVYELKLGFCFKKRGQSGSCSRDLNLFRALIWGCFFQKFVTGIFECPDCLKLIYKSLQKFIYTPWFKTHLQSFCGWQILQTLLSTRAVLNLNPPYKNHPNLRKKKHLNSTIPLKKSPKVVTTP